MFRKVLDLRLVSLFRCSRDSTPYSSSVRLGVMYARSARSVTDWFLKGNLGPADHCHVLLILYIQLLAAPIHESYHPPGVPHAWFGQADWLGLEIRVGYRELIGTTPWRSTILTGSSGHQPGPAASVS